MFTGIIECTGEVLHLTQEGGNIHFEISSSISGELKIDQSIAHDGVCLTVVALNPSKNSHTVTAIHETLLKTNLSQWKPGRKINLERCMILGGRLDGHIVQGHVDTTATCIEARETNGSWYFRFRYNTPEHVTVEKGSICINGVSLTVIDSDEQCFSVAIIPYTWEHTGFHQLNKGDTVNLEFDIIGKYIARLMKR